MSRSKKIHKKSAFLLKTYEILEVTLHPSRTKVSKTSSAGVQMESASSSTTPHSSLKASSLSTLNTPTSTPSYDK